MALTVKILLTLTLIMTIGRSIAGAITITTVSMLADRSLGAHTEAQRKKMADLSGKAVLIAIGTTLWQGALGAGVWIWL